jgi:lysophospholipase L1-like esterase
MVSTRRVPRLIVLFLILLAFAAAGAGWYFIDRMDRNTVVIAAPQVPTPTAVPDDSFKIYKAPNIASKDSYLIFMLGDSMTHALGPHGGTFNEFMNEKYKPHGRSILIDNYARSSTSILTIKEAMTTETTYWDSTFKPLLEQKFDLILIESFGYNPMSQFSLEEGLKKQTEILTETMKTLQTDHPEAAVVFVATIAPNKEHYAEKVLLELTTEDRVKQAEERIAYIKNHMDYAKAHSIPLINIYEKSLTETGDGDLAYINPDDYIHPSFAGVDFIGRELTSFIYDNNILPR